MTVKNKMIVYQGPGGGIEPRGDMSKETIWATQSQIAEVFDLERSVVTKHVNNVLKSEEVDVKSNVQKMHIANSDKAAHLLYFVVKTHPFVDGNKRSGAFAFIWFLRRAGALDIRSLTPAALTALTLLIAESKPKDKERIIGLVILLLKR